MNVLLAEQSRAVGLALQRLLTQKGHAVEIAYDGVQALNLLMSEGYDLLITEIDLPRLSGGALVKSAAARGVEIKAVGLLSHSEVTVKDLADGYGMDALLPKPFSGRELAELLERLERDPESGKGGALGYWQRLLLNELSERDATPSAELAALLPRRCGSLLSFVRATNEILARTGSGKKILSAEDGYKVVGV